LRWLEAAGSLILPGTDPRTTASGKAF